MRETSYIGMQERVIKVKNGGKKRVSVILTTNELCRWTLCVGFIQSDVTKTKRRTKYDGRKWSRCVFQPSTISCDVDATAEALPSVPAPVIVSALLRPSTGLEGSGGMNPGASPL